MGVFSFFDAIFLERCVPPLFPAPTEEKRGAGEEGGGERGGRGKPSLEVEFDVGEGAIPIYGGGGGGGGGEQTWDFSLPLRTRQKKGGRTEEEEEEEERGEALLPLPASARPSW